jgi:predicted nucleic acid-binding protein
MLVISDTSPLNYLVLIDAVHVLPAMYGRILIPSAVAAELAAEGAPSKTRLWFAQRPEWLEIHPVFPPQSYPDLDAGEAEAINLANTLHADLILIDERRATSVARNQEHLTTIGTLGVLLDAAMSGLLNLPSSLATLKRDTTFRAPASLYDQILKEYDRRMQR